MKKPVLLFAIIAMMLASCIFLPDWKKFENSAEHYVARFPGTPLQFDSNNPDDPTVVAHNTIVKHNGKGYMVASIDATGMLEDMKGHERKYLEKYRDLLAGDFGATSVQTTGVYPAKHPHIDYMFIKDDVFYKYRLYIIDHTLYLVSAFGPKEDGITTDMGKFINSFVYTGIDLSDVE